MPQPMPVRAWRYGRFMLVPSLRVSDDQTAIEESGTAERESLKGGGGRRSAYSDPTPRAGSWSRENHVPLGRNGPFDSFVDTFRVSRPGAPRPGRSGSPATPDAGTPRERSG